MSSPLTRKEYCLNVRCPRLLWLERYGEKDISFDERAFSDTYDFAAQELYCKKLAKCAYIAEDNLYMAHAKTSDILTKKFLYIRNGAFCVGPVSCRPDLLKKESDGTYTLYTIKSATHLRQIVCHDAAYQMFVLAACGIAVSNVIFVHVNADFVRARSDENSLFAEERIFPRVRSALSSVERRLTSALKVLKCKTLPDISIQNSCFIPYDCECHDTCFSLLPKNNVFDLSGLNRQIKFKLYSQGLSALSEAIEHPLMPAEQCHQIQMFLDGEDAEINKEALKKWMNTLHYPMYFLDFESMQLPIPVFSGTKPFEQVAFQYSLHCLKAPGEEPTFTSFIAKPGEDPRRAMAERLASDIPEDACVIAYASQLEKKVLTTLAGMYPDLRKKLLRISSHVSDIMIPFEKKYYYHPNTLGANSLKAVLHALYPEEKELDYKCLTGVHNGKEAAVSYGMAVSSVLTGKATVDPDTVVSELLEYCSLDTLALIKILNKFYEALN